tara:strand:- start:83 stop:259 length:177 start_codon:yes stop_codon:yes gene_type:complete
MKKYLKEWWTIYAIGIFSGLITTVKKDNGDNIDYWWLYIILWAFVVGAIDTYFRKNKK